MILQLSKNILIEQEQNGKPIGDLTYKKKDFGLFVDVQNVDVLNDSFDVVLKVIRLEDKAIINTLPTSIPIKPEGRDSDIVENQTEVDEYLNAVEANKALIKLLREALNTMGDEYKSLVNSEKQKQKDLDTLIAEKEALENPTEAQLQEIDDAIATLYTELTDINQAYTEKAIEINEKQIELQAAVDEANALKEVKPQYKKIDKYEEIIDINIKNNKLTDLGLAWVRELPMLKGKVKDYIV